MIWYERIWRLDMFSSPMTCLWRHQCQNDFVVFAVFGHDKCVTVRRNSWFFSKICAGCTNLQCLKCNRLVSLRHNRGKSAISGNACLKEKTLSWTCSTFMIIIKFYQQIDLVNNGKSTKFGEVLFSNDGIVTLQIIRHDVKIWLCQNSQNVGIALKLSMLAYLVQAKS